MIDVFDEDENTVGKYEEERMRLPLEPLLRTSSSSARMTTKTLSTKEKEDRRLAFLHTHLRLHHWLWTKTSAPSTKGSKDDKPASIRLSPHPIIAFDEDENYYSRTALSEASETTTLSKTTTVASTLESTISAVTTPNVTDICLGRSPYGLYHIRIRSQVVLVFDEDENASNKENKEGSLASTASAQRIAVITDDDADEFYPQMGMGLGLEMTRPMAPAGSRLEPVDGSLPSTRRPVAPKLSLMLDTLLIDFWLARWQQ
ncbi:uncharacterized protein GGS25DRAFT_523512 [Hypoxylon fragiforme]|uniref:uncharacterized protein n=1 Tax=Hypoxylon fragiforme TaxID=63214 RepID=UPI0020C611AC|nr:uncharacterized protein GGS25DRAFT_523512 [Hypoxylon fragiforme]KAI2605838.1 hypothetical protein GGS25DRAFT_523512 [Hypoxylon fragiforme]